VLSFWFHRGNVVEDKGKEEQSKRGYIYKPVKEHVLMSMYFSGFRKEHMRTTRIDFGFRERAVMLCVMRTVLTPTRSRVLDIARLPISVDWSRRHAQNSFKNNIKQNATLCTKSQHAHYIDITQT
jgi:hypothetical protein